MSYEQFWNDSPLLYYDYEKAYEEKLKEKDILNWQLGNYIQLAFGSCQDSNVKYPKNPMFMAKEPEKELTLEEKLMNMFQQINRKFE